MNLGKSLVDARKKCGLSQERVAEKIGKDSTVSEIVRLVIEASNTKAPISKWETNETLPDIYQAKRLSKLYNLSLDELIGFDIELKEIEDVIKNTDEKIESKINWTNAWGKKYPVLLDYPSLVDVEKYARIIRQLLDSLATNYGYSKLDSMLVLKDILYHEWKDKK